MFKCEGQPGGHRVMFFSTWKLGGHRVILTLDYKGQSSGHQVISTLDYEGPHGGHYVVFFA